MVYVQLAVLNLLFACLLVCLFATFTQGWYLYLVMVRWFGLRIDILSVLFLAIVAFVSIPLASGKHALYAASYS